MYSIIFHNLHRDYLSLEELYEDNEFYLPVPNIAKITNDVNSQKGYSFTGKYYTCLIVNWDKFSVLPSYITRGMGTKFHNYIMRLIRRKTITKILCVV